MTNNYYHYRINNKNVHCAKIKEDETNSLSSKNGEQICRNIDSIKASIMYNSGRMSKLSDEYKCSSTYRYNKHDPKPNPNCNNKVYEAFKPKFEEAEKATKNLNSKYKYSTEYNINELITNAKSALLKFQDLSSFTIQHKDAVNAAFEVAYYDTNLMGGLLFFTGLFVAPVAFAGHVMNVALSNNEFDGKIDRAISDVETIISSANEISYLLGSISGSEIYG